MAVGVANRISSAVRRAASRIGAVRADGWSNVLTGLGHAQRDKRMYSSPGSPPILGEQYLSDLYSGDPLARRICDLPANEQTREWIRFTSDAGAETNKAVQQALEVMGAQDAIREAISWSRLYGGAVVLLGADDGGQLWQPLRDERVRSLSWLTVLDRYNLEIASRYDRFGPKFRQPQFYRVIGANAGTDFGDVIHESRVLRFDGVPTTRLRRDENNGWCDSVFVALADKIRDVWGGFDGAAHLMTDFSQAVIKIKNLASLMESNRESVIVARLQLLDMVRSVVRAAVVDADGEDVERKSTSVAGLPELLDRLEQMLSAVTGIPVTLLMGRSPAGENATGDADIRFFYDSIRATQQSTLRPLLERLTTLLLRAGDGPTSGREPANWSFAFNPLWQLTELQEAERRNKQAQTDQVYISEGVVHPAEVRKSRFGGDAYSTETTLDPQYDDLDELLRNASDDAPPGDEDDNDEGGDA